MKSLQEQKGRRALKLLQRIPGCAISVCWEETQLASCRDLTSHVCKKMRKSWTKHSPKMHNCREQSRGACQTTQHILSCLRNPATAQVQGKRQTHSESHHSPVNRGPDSCWTAYWASSYGLAAQYASEHWNALVGCSQIKGCHLPYGLSQQSPSMPEKRPGLCGMEMRVFESWGLLGSIRPCLLLDLRAGESEISFLDTPPQSEAEKASLYLHYTLIVLHPLIKAGHGCSDYLFTCLRVACSYLFSSTHMSTAPPFFITWPWIQASCIFTLTAYCSPAKNHISLRIPFIYH